jgi:plasmid stabilization system protein ParE
MTKAEKEALDREVKNIAENPNIGEEKKGDLKGVFIHKFKLKTNLYLLAYRKADKDLELVMIGSHENYYRDLKSYLFHYAFKMALIQGQLVKLLVADLFAAIFFNPNSACFTAASSSSKTRLAK